MSRRHTYRALDPDPTPTTTTSDLDAALDFFTEAGIPMWFATRMPDPWGYWYWHQWPSAWAEHTLAVAETVWRNVGARLYAAHRDKELRDDLRDWLLVTAVESAAAYTPDPWHPAPERKYGAWLYKRLKEHARYHFAAVVGHDSNGPKSGASAEGYRRTGPSIEAQAEHVAAGGAAFTHHALWTRPIEQGDPASVIIRLEELNEHADDAERHGTGVRFFSTAPASTTCLMNLCDRPVMGRGLCQKHYAFERNRAVERGDWQPYQAPEGCEVDGCDEPHSARGRCARHYRDARPTCPVEGCQKKQERMGLCAHHYEQQHAPRCTVEGCQTIARVEGMCHRHHADPSLPPRATPRGGVPAPIPCEIPGCDTPHYAKGLCNKHYKAERRGRIQR